MGFMLSIFLLSIFVGLDGINNVSAEGEEEDDAFPQGDMFWDMPDEHRLYLAGQTGEIANLTRTRPTDSSPTGTEIVGYTGISGAQEIIYAEAPPAINSINVSVNLSVYLHGIIRAPFANYCKTTGWGTLIEKSTRIDVNILVNGQVIHSASSDEIVIDTINDADPANFTIDDVELNLTIMSGGILALQISVDHQCENSEAQFNWGSFGSASGIVIEGNFVQPVVEGDADDIGLAHIQMSSNSPWGLDDVSNTKLTIYGPIYDDQFDTDDFDLVIQDFNLPMGSKKIEMNQSAYTWVSDVPLEPGHYLAKFCIQVVDGNTINYCHIEGSYRVIVEEEDADLFTAWWWLASISLLMLIGWIGFAFKQGLLYPPPMMAAFLVLMILLIPLQMQLPSLEMDYNAREDGAATSFSLIGTSGEGANESSFIHLNDLLDGHSAVVIGVFQPGSPNAVDQYDNFARTMAKTDDIAFAQLATGNNIQLIDIEEHAAIVNGSWPVMVDEKDSKIAKQFPTGASDGIVIIDASHTITWWKVGSASDGEIIKAIGNIDNGGQQSITSVFSLLWTCAFTLLLVALPRKKWEAPEEPLPPGGYWASLMLNGVAGFAVVALPIIILTTILGVGEFWLWIQVGLAAWLIFQAAFVLKKGNSLEAGIVGALLRKLYTNGYTEWRGADEIRNDVQIGIWIGWLSWLMLPMLMPQGISATMRSGLWGIVMGVLLLIGLFICVGFVNLFIRLIASWGGPLSRMFGKIGQPEFARFYGFLILPIAIWMLLFAVIQVKAAGLI